MSEAEKHAGTLLSVRDAAQNLVKSVTEYSQGAYLQINQLLSENNRYFKSSAHPIWL